MLFIDDYLASVHRLWKADDSYCQINLIFRVLGYIELLAGIYTLFPCNFCPTDMTRPMEDECI